ncbi:cell envelope biogenesis protein TolA [Blastomonas sp.]|uniref:cell envelope biogenesis protein TolA n=1 Tax=Blastomonas sp. TaxID=1909299 RepID=UPI002609D344|nr:cell envelope biogenesis protein TolA [Blastomonas sp.]MDM7956376.1 cell envelope biogenesis protein TolA [Blastomonas sp.]
MEKSERLGLSVAVVAHVALFGVLSLGIASRSELKMPTEPISVQLTDEVGLVSTAPSPSQEAATATAPELAPEIEKAQPAPEPEPTPAPAVKRPEPPAPRAVERPSPPKPKAAERPRPAPVPKPARSTPPPPAKPQPKAAEKPKPAAPADTSDRRRPDRPAAQPAAKAPRAPRIGKDFLEGVTDKASTSRSQTPPASVAGPAVVASLQRELLRQVKPHWVPPTGADADQLRTKVTVRLDESGNIVGSPSATTTGVTSSNRAQEGLHKERAIAAVRRAAPFKFPPQFYSEWQTIEPTFYLGL